MAKVTSIGECMVELRQAPGGLFSRGFGGDTLRVIQRDNLPSPVVAGTTYRNVYVAVELIGRMNAECLADRLGIGNNAPTGAQSSSSANRPAAAAPTSASSCAFLGGSAGAGSQNARPPTP